MAKRKLTGQPNLLKEVNKGLIKEALHKLQMATRVELSTATKISQPTVNLIVNELLKEGMVVESGMAKSNGGRKAVLYSLNSGIWLVLSVVVEKHELRYAVTDLQNEIIDEGRIKNKSTWTVEDLTDSIARLLKGRENIKALSVGVPGSVSKEGVVAAIPRVECLEGFPLKQHLKDRFDLRVTIGNDINTIALGYYSEHPEEKDTVCIHLGDTLGAAMILGGKVIYGAGNFAGEIGFMQTEAKLKAQEIRLYELSEKEAVLTVSKIMINMICIINPATLLLSGHTPTKAQKTALMKNCAATVPEAMLPKIIFLEEEDPSYMKGLAQAGLDSMNSDVRLVQ